jgi:hypothetical protein
MTDDNEAVCTSTGAALSVRATASLRQIVRSTVPLQADPVPFRWRVEWFCPADGEALVEAHGHVACTVCGRVLPSDLIHQLIEVNPH